ncbi:hypothetical protein C8R44DRAFT_989699 [Mycena epipterygia]|nr:hypothetical protein C8R44DRAFT_989699 [Mycena epipterygia]
MSDSQQKTLGGPQGFPAAWLTPMDEKYVIDRAHWNTEGVPNPEMIYPHFSVLWDKYPGIRLLRSKEYPAEISSLLVRLYFGLVGCIIPVGWLTEVEPKILLFTLAGPCDKDGKKEFFVLVHDMMLHEASLSRYSPGFSSVADWLSKCGKMAVPPSIEPVAGGEESVVAEYVRLGLCAYASGREGTESGVYISCSRY